MSAYCGPKVPTPDNIYEIQTVSNIQQIMPRLDFQLLQICFFSLAAEKLGRTGTFLYGLEKGVKGQLQIQLPHCSQTLSVDLAQPAETLAMTFV